MYNDLNKELFRKYFSLEKRESIRIEAMNLFSDIIYFEEHMERLKKSNFRFKVSFHEKFNEKSLSMLFKDYSALGLNSDRLYDVLVIYNLTKYFINKTYENELTDEIEKDLVEMSNYWTRLYGCDSIAQFVGDFVGCSMGINSTKEKIISIIHKHSA